MNAPMVTGALVPNGKNCEFIPRPPWGWFAVDAQTGAEVAVVQADGLRSRGDGVQRVRHPVIVDGGLALFVIWPKARPATSNRVEKTSFSDFIGFLRWNMSRFSFLESAKLTNS